MKTNHLCRRFLTPVVMLMGFAAALTGDIPGGPGRILTPFADPEHVTEQQVTEAKAICAKTRRISRAALSGTNAPVSGDQIGVAWARGSVLSGEPVFAFQGSDPNGQKVSADFSEIETILMMSVDGHLLSPNEVTLECKLFPTITPADLVKTKPDFAKLEDDYTKTIRIRFAVTDNQKGDLCLVKRGAQRYEVMARIADLKPNSEIKFEYGRHRFGDEDRTAIWWAVGSVVKDPRYPHKLVFKR